MKDSDKTVEEKEKLKKLVDIYWGRYNGDRFYKDELLDLVTEVSAASRREAQEEILGDMFKMLDALPYRQLLPKHILATDLHEYAKMKEIKVLQLEEKGFPQEDLQ